MPRYRPAVAIALTVLLLAGCAKNGIRNTADKADDIVVTATRAPATEAMVDEAGDIVVTG